MAKCSNCSIRTGIFKILDSIICYGCWRNMEKVIASAGWKVKPLKRKGKQ